jgi:hypothetical protein
LEIVRFNLRFIKAIYIITNKEVNNSLLVLKSLTTIPYCCYLIAIFGNYLYLALNANRVRCIHDSASNMHRAIPYLCSMKQLLIEVSPLLVSCLQSVTLRHFKGVLYLEYLSGL